MNPKTTSRSLPGVSAEAIPDPAAVQSAINQRLAVRLGVSLPVAAVYAVLAGIGPEMRRAAR